jgi:hypothetical protein
MAEAPWEQGVKKQNNSSPSSTHGSLSLSPSISPRSRFSPSVPLPVCCSLLVDFWLISENSASHREGRVH